VAFPGRQVVCVVGDGGFTMLMGEVATLVKYQLPVKVIIIKNNVLGQIKWEQMVLDGNPEFGVELQSIDFAGYAKNCGAAGYTIEDPRTAESILREALQHPGPAIIQAVVDPNEPPMPGKISTKQAFHFAEALARGERDGWKIFKTVLKDKVREVV
jgi:pyruvate dehydrogenase (quinone)